MKTIGLLGGMSWESSHEYHRLINEGVRDALGGSHSAHLVLYSVDFEVVERLQAASRWDEAADLLRDAGLALQRAGAEFLVLATNTMHLVADQMMEGLSVPLLHLVDTTADAIRAAGPRRVGLLGTAFTMEQGFYTERMCAHGIDVVVPDTGDRALIHGVIYDELVRGIVRDESRRAYRDVMDRLVVDGAEGIILGCTEIELLVGPDDASVPVFPTTRLHAAAAVDYALGWADLPTPPAPRDLVDS
jgi:aspartate racemase